MKTSFADKHRFEVWSTQGWDSRWSSLRLAAERVCWLALQGDKEPVAHGDGREFPLWECRRLATGAAPPPLPHPDALGGLT